VGQTPGQIVLISRTLCNGTSTGEAASLITKLGRRDGLDRQTESACFITSLIDGHRRCFAYCRAAVHVFNGRIAAVFKILINAVATESLGGGRGTRRAGQLGGICLHCTCTCTYLLRTAFLAGTRRVVEY